MQNQLIEKRLFSVIHDYGNLENLCEAYSGLANSLSTKSIQQEQAALLLHYLTEKLLECTEELKAIKQLTNGETNEE